MSLRSRADCVENIELVKTWLAKCKAHPTCADVMAHASDFDLPTRLIDLGLPASTSNPRLVLSQDIDSSSDCRYITLSHCWGDPNKIPQTRTATLEAHQRAITELSKTFEDAIAVSKVLGIRYLWIDSLCIIQDDRADFERECANMHLIYSRSFVTLSALDSVDGSGGLFRARNLDAIQSAKPIEWGEALVGPLATRGWAYQEQQLSPRVIHFSNMRLLWECRVSIALEDLPAMRWRGTLPSGFQQSATWRLLDGRPENFVNLDKYSNLHRMRDLYTRWLRSVEIYSARKLSHLSDKLPAISGLAAAMWTSLMPGDKYLAGIWQKDIGRGLMWRRAKDVKYELVTDNGRRLCLNDIPSWSWASFNGGVVFLGVGALGEEPIRDQGINGKFGFRKSRALFDFRSAEATNPQLLPSSLDPFGKFDRDTLKMTSSMASVHLGAFKAQNNVVWQDTLYSVEMQTIPDAEAYLDVSLYKILSYELGPALDFDSIKARDIIVDRIVHLYCFELLDQDDTTGRRWGHKSGLLLLKTGNDTYQRVGIYERGRGSDSYLKFERTAVSIK